MLALAPAKWPINTQRFTQELVHKYNCPYFQIRSWMKSGYLKSENYGTMNRSSARFCSKIVLRFFKKLVKAQHLLYFFQVCASETNQTKYLSSDSLVTDLQALTP